MFGLTAESEGGLPLNDSTRPDWTLFGKVNQNMETVLFREKFFDWPDASRLISVKGNDDEAKVSSRSCHKIGFDNPHGQNLYLLVTSKKKHLKKENSNLSKTIGVPRKLN